MYFLVILICLIINYLWLQDYDRFDDSWFFKLRARAEQLTSDLAEKSATGWSFSVVLIYGPPLFLLGILLLLVEGRAYGMLTMLVHIIILLIAFDRVQPGRLAKDFLVKWREGDVDGCARFIKQRLSAAHFEEINDADAMSQFFSKQLIYRWFERMFVMFFWYMLTGPMGVLFCYLTYQLRDSHRPDQSQAEVEFITRIIDVLEWAPLRLLALAFSLAGNFEGCFERIKETFWEFGWQTDAGELLYSYARCALSGFLSTAAEGDSIEAAREQKAAEILSIQGLLERSQLIWLIVLALITVSAAFVQPL